MPQQDPNFQITFLENVHKIDEAAAGVLQGIELIIEGGPAGLAETAAQNPEAFIEAFGNIHTIIAMQREMLKSMTEHSLQIVDELEKRFPEV